MSNTFEIGFLKPDGTLIACEHYEHTSKAFDICMELDIPCKSEIDAEDKLLDIGYVEIRARDVVHRIGFYKQDKDGNVLDEVRHLTQDQRNYLTEHYEEYNTDLKKSVDELMDMYDAYAQRNKQFLNLLGDGQYKEETKSSALDEAIKHAEEVAKEQDKLCKRYDDASGYTRSHNEELRTTDAKKSETCAAEHRQLAEWLRELKQLREQSRWIPISEGLPKETGWYYVSFETYHGEIEACELCYRQPENYWTGHDIRIKALDNKDIVAWMPRPQPYQPDKNLQREQDETFEQEEEEL